MSDRDLDIPVSYICANEPTRIVFEAIGCEFDNVGKGEIYTGMADHAIDAVVTADDPDLSWVEMRQLGEDILLLWREPYNDDPEPPFSGTTQFLEEIREHLAGRWEDVDPVAVGGWAAMYAGAALVREASA